MGKAKWWQITLIIIVLYPLGTIIGRLIAGKPINWDEMSPFVVTSVLIGIVMGLLAKFVKRDRAKQDKN